MNSVIRIYKNANLQYFLIYFMFIINSSSLFSYFDRSLGDKSITYIAIVVVIGMFFMISKRNNRNYYVLTYLVVMLIVITFVRFTQGGVGLGLWYEWAIMLLITSLAITVDRFNFLERFVKITTFFALVSLICFAIQLIAPDILKSLLTEYESGVSWKTYTSGTNFIETNYKGYGFFLYSFHDNELTRNSGMYSEPGVYQLVLCTGLFVLLFFNKYMKLSLKNIRRYLGIITLAIVTSQSSTGLIGFLLIVMFFLLFNRSFDYRKAKIYNYLLVAATIGVVFIVCDVSFRGDESLLNEVVIDKFFVEKDFDLDAGTGRYRVASITYSMLSMIKHPLGIGFDNLNKYLQLMYSGSTGAALFRTGAALGILPFIFIIIWVLYPIFNTKTDRISKILFVFLFFNTQLAQSHILYPGLIVIPLVFQLCLSNEDFLNKYKDKKTIKVLQRKNRKYI